MPSPKSKVSKQTWYQAVWYRSWTKSYAYTQGIGAAVLASVTGLSQVLSSSEFSNVLDKLSVPYWVPILISILALGTWLAHGRSDA